MNLTESNIRKIVAGIPVGEFPPFSDSDIGACDQYARKLCNKIENSKVLEVKTELDDYGSGYASYFDLFIIKKDKIFHEEKVGYVEYKELVYIYHASLQSLCFAKEQELKATLVALTVF